MLLGSGSLTGTILGSGASKKGVAAAAFLRSFYWCDRLGPSGGRLQCQPWCRGLGEAASFRYLSQDKLFLFSSLSGCIM